MVGCGEVESGKKTLTVGMELQYPPFEMANKAGEPIGISVEIAKEFGKCIDREVIIKPIEWSGLIPALRTGKIDVIISSMSPTPERSKVVNFSEPYLKNSLAILVKKDSKIQNFSDVDQNSIIAVKLGTIGDVFVHKQFNQSMIRQFKNVNACVMEVVLGQADLFIYDPLTLYKNHIKHKETTTLILDEVPGTSNFCAMAFDKSNPELLQKANQFIRETRKSDFFNNLGDRYLLEMKLMYKEKGLPFFFDLD